MQIVQELIQIENTENQQFKINKGKESEAQQALMDLTQCQGNLSQAILSIQAITNITDVLISDQLNFCLNDCVKNEQEEEGKKCIRTCYDSIYNHALPATHKLMDNTISKLEEQMNKL